MAKLTQAQYDQRRRQRLVPEKIERELEQQGGWAAPFFIESSNPYWRDQWTRPEEGKITPQQRAHRKGRGIKWLEVPEKLNREIAHLADEAGLPTSRYVMKVLYDHLVERGADTEGLYDQILTPQILARIRNREARDAVKQSR